jgi:uncharacterized protein YcfJ
MEVNVKRLTMSIIASLGLALLGTAYASDHFVRYENRDDSYFDYARVERVDRVLSTVTEPVNKRECWNEPRTEYHPDATYRRDEVSPTTVASVNGEPVVHSEVVESGGYYTQSYEQQCRTRTDYDTAQHVVGYDVVYNYRGEDYHDRMNHDPGAQVRVHIENGYVEVAE